MYLVSACMHGCVCNKIEVLNMCSDWLRSLKENTKINIYCIVNLVHSEKIKCVFGINNSTYYSDA